MSDANGRSGRGTVTAQGPRLQRARRAALPGGTNPEGLPARRRWARVAAGAVLALLGGWVFASLYQSAGERVEVIALSADVDRYAAIEREDLRMVRVAADPGVETIDGGDVDDIVGRYAAVDLVEGSLLTDGQVLAAGAEVVSANEVIVGAELTLADAPQSALVGGAEVQVVIQPSASASASAGGEAPEAASVVGWLLHVGEPDENTRARPVEIVVPRTESAAVQAAAAEERLSLSVLGR